MHDRDLQEFVLGLTPYRLADRNSNPPVEPRTAGVSFVQTQAARHASCGLGTLARSG
jgi:hypothetical protein